jgi:hypothetical protein
LICACTAFIDPEIRSRERPRCSAFSDDGLVLFEGCAAVRLMGAVVGELTGAGLAPARCVWFGAPAGPELGVGVAAGFAVDGSFAFVTAASNSAAPLTGWLR